MMSLDGREALNKNVLEERKLLVTKGSWTRKIALSSKKF